MTLEFLMPQLLHHQQEETMYRQPNPSTPTYPSYNYSQTPTSQYTSEYLPVPGSVPYQASATADVQQQAPPPVTTNSWMSTGFTASGLSSAVDCWSSPSSQDPFSTISGSYPVQTPAAPMGGSPYNTEELDYYQGFGASTTSVNTVSQALHRPAMRSPYQDWMRSTAYRVNPQTGKTRTKDKYRVVYSDHQRLELEKEFHYSRYITIRRKAELAVSLGLSERQVKIWFQNRRAKERKQNKKRAASEGVTTDQSQMDASSDKTIMEGELDMKKENTITDKLEPIHNSPSTTPEMLDCDRSHHQHHHHHRTVLQPELGMESPQLPLLARGACQIESIHHTIMTDTLLHDIPQMLLK